MDTSSFANNPGIIDERSIKRCRNEPRRRFPATSGIYSNQPKPLADRTSDIVVCKKQKTSYRLTKTVSSVWLFFILFMPGLFAVTALRLPNLFWNILLALAVIISANVLPGLYSYYRTEFEKVEEEKPGAEEKDSL